MISVTCPSCRTVVYLQEQLAGKAIRCKNCQQVFKVGALPGAPKPATSEVPVVRPIAKTVAKPVDPLREGLQSRPGRVPPPIPDVASPPRRSLPRRDRSKNPSMFSFGLLVGGGAAGAVLLIGVTIAAVLLLQKKGDGDSKTVAKVSDSPSFPLIARHEASSPRPSSREEASSPPPSHTEPRERPPAEPPQREAPLPPPAGGDNNGQSPAALLEHLKSATIFVKVEGREIKATGSGFVVQVTGDTCYVVTNAHVIDPKIEIEIRPRQGGFGGMPGMPAMPSMPRFGPGRSGFPRGPMGPMGPMGPRFGGGPPQSGNDESLKIVVPMGDATISLVFWSGTRRERSHAAQVVASDRQRDLAVLKVTGCANPPRPIDLSQSPSLQETVPVFVFGFPFGDSLAMNKGNPAITVGKGSVSSIRRDERDELAYVQIDGALNPGNSGGPVVDSQGRLVGVAVKTIKGAGIGLAIPAGKLTGLLQGKT